jgi:outer membrane biosynthesis protein TonB
MRIGTFLSIAAHAAAVTAGMVAGPVMLRESTPMMILPVELLTIADMTNVMAAAEEEAITEEELTAQAAPAPAPAPAPEAEAAPEIVPETVPAPKPPEKKPEATPAPPAPKRETPKKEENFEDALQGILQSVEKTEARPAPRADRATPNLAAVGEKARAGVGDKSAMTITVADFIRDQLQRKGCWGDQKDMADARRLRTVISVRFGRDGKFSDAPKLLEPTRPPAGDPPMQVFIQRAFSALNKCNTMGYQVPPEYFEGGAAPWIEIEFLP